MFFGGAGKHSGQVNSPLVGSSLNFILSSSKLRAVEQNEKLTWDSILQEDHAMHFKPQMKKFCCVSVMVLKTNVEGEIFFLSGFYK